MLDDGISLRALLWYKNMLGLTWLIVWLIDWLIDWLIWLIDLIDYWVQHSYNHSWKFLEVLRITLSTNLERMQQHHHISVSDRHSGFLPHWYIVVIPHWMENVTTFLYVQADTTFMLQNVSEIHTKSVLMLN
jgi:hypothetical protein